AWSHRLALPRCGETGVRQSPGLDSFPGREATGVPPAAATPTPLGHCRVRAPPGRAPTCLRHALDGRRITAPEWPTSSRADSDDVGSGPGPEERRLAWD